MGSSVNVEWLLKTIIRNNITSSNRLVAYLDVLILTDERLKQSSTDGFLLKDTRTVVVATDLMPLYEMYLIAHELAHLVLGHVVPRMYSEHRMTALPEEVEADIVAFVHVMLYMNERGMKLHDPTDIADKIGVPHSRVSSIRKALAIINRELVASGYDYAQ